MPFVGSLKRFLRPNHHKLNLRRKPRGKLRLRKNWRSTAFEPLHSIAIRPKEIWMNLFRIHLTCILRELAKFERRSVTKPLGRTSILRMLVEDFRDNRLNGALPVDGM